MKNKHYLSDSSIVLLACILFAVTSESALAWVSACDADCPGRGRPPSQPSSSAPTTGGSSGSYSSGGGGGINPGAAAAIGAGIGLLTNILSSASRQNSAPEDVSRQQARAQAQAQQNEELRKNLEAYNDLSSSLDKIQEEAPPRSDAEKQAWDAALAHCAQDATDISDSIKTSDMKMNLNQPISEMVAKEGTASRAIAYLSAQKSYYKKAMKEAANAAKQSYGNQGDPLAYNCEKGEGVYCSANHMYWLTKDAIKATEYQIEALNCYRQYGVE